MILDKLLEKKDLEIYIDVRIRKLLSVKITQFPEKQRVSNSFFDLNENNNLIFDNKKILHQTLNAGIGAELSEFDGNNDYNNFNDLLNLNKNNKFDLIDNNKNKNTELNNYLAGFKTCFNPIIVNPTISLVSSKYLATIPEPKSRLNAFFGLPNEISNTSASLSYSQETCPGFSTINFSILSTSSLKCLNNKQLTQTHQIETIPDKLQQDIYSLLQEFCQTSLLLKEFQCLPSEQNQDCLCSLLSDPQHYLVQDDGCKYALNALLLTLLEHHSLKKLLSFDNSTIDNYKNLSVSSLNLSTFINSRTAQATTCLDALNSKINNINQINDYKLINIKDIYENHKDREIHFLDEKGNEIKINSINKENYTGKIYDVDVENNIVLVRRKNENNLDLIGNNKNFDLIKNKLLHQTHNVDCCFDDSDYISDSGQVTDLRNDLGDGFEKFLSCFLGVSKPKKWFFVGCLGLIAVTFLEKVAKTDFGLFGAFLRVEMEKKRSEWV